MNIRLKILPTLGFLILLAGNGFGGALQRVPNNTLAMPSQPPTHSGYSLTNAFGALIFNDAVCIVTPPGETNRIFVVERGGTIAVITNLAAPTRTVFLNMASLVTYAGEGGLLSLAFHPGFATNGYFYVWYYGPDTTTSAGAHDILSRFQVSATNANFADPATEVRFIRQRDTVSNHNGGTLQFSADGYLYLSMGDEGDQNDSHPGGTPNSQRIDKNYFSAMIRIDVDKKPGNLPANAHPSVTTNYLVPADNPYVGATNFNGSPVVATNVRTEFWAVGFRNPFRWSFDPPTGRLYEGDVGQDNYEEVNIIVKGGNYGWNYRDAASPGPRAATPGFTSIDPILFYNHGFTTNQGLAIIGGVVYRGSQLSQLTGAYVFGDNSSGNIWMLRYDGTNVSNWAQITSVSGPAGFGTDPRNGDILIAARDVNGGPNINQTLKRLVYQTSTSGTPLPATLADTGAFSNLTTLAPNAGIVPYDLNVPFWSDGAVKSRWMSVPNTNLTVGFNASNNWTFPAGTVWIKHFDLQTNDSPPMSTRVETRLLVRNSNGVYGVTYRWGGATTNATLVPEGGMDEDFVINEGGNLRTQRWHYPSWSECLTCHTPVAGLALGFNTAQLNRSHDYSGTVTNQLKALSDAGYFSAAVSNVYTLPALAAATDTTVSREYRVRSYLAANCVQCHQPGGNAGAVLWDARLSTPGPQAAIINGALVNNLGDTNNRVIKPGSLSNSVMYARVANLGPSHMPPLATSVVNAQAAQLLSDWIVNDLPSYQSFPAWQLAQFGSTNGPNTGSQADFDGDGARNYLEYLTGTGPTNAASYWKIGITAAGGQAVVSYPQIANRGFEVQCTTNILNPNSWTPLNVPGNAPFFSVSNRTALVPDAIANSTKYYRVRVYEP